MRAQHVLRRDGNIWVNVKLASAKRVPNGGQALGTGVNPICKESNPMYKGDPE
jgi:hypothetical protein